jgi:hypothetical protein
MFGAMRLFSVCLAFWLQNSVQGRSSLPYELPSTPNASTLMVYDPAALTPTQQFAVATLQGVLGRTTPMLFGNESAPGSSSPLWLQELETSWGVKADVLPSTNLFATIVQRSVAFLPDGYVLANLSNPDSVSAAASALGILDAIAVDYADVGVIQSLHLPQAWDATSATTLDAIARWNNTKAAFSSRVAVIQDPTKLCCLWDAAAMMRAPVWWSTTLLDNATSTVLNSLQKQSAVLGWGTSEFGLVSAATSRGSWVNAADWAKNIGTLAGYPTAGNVEQPNSSPPPQPATPPQRHTISFLMSDGDNLQWLLNSFATGSNWWGSSVRGSVPMGWTLSPALAELAPPAISYLYRTATVRDGPGSACDVFVSGPSGAGYAYPDLMDTGDQLQAFANSTRDAAVRAGHKIVNVLGHVYAEPAARAMAAAVPDGGIIWYNFDPYDALKGNLTFFDGVPVIGSRYMLWKGFDTPQSIIQDVLKLPADPTTSDGYTIVVVNAWSSSMDQVAQVVQGLQGHPVDVVCPDELIARVTKYAQ